jgi:5'-nucleotidase
MRILVTNDDGVTAPGLEVAEAIARELAGPSGDVWVVAPDNERSGVSHCISYTAPMRLTRLGERRFSVEGNPADCVILGIHHLMADIRPDLVLSGVNRGHNVAEDTAYSGTVGGAMEGALQGVRAIALSQYYSRDAGDDMFAASRALGAAAVRKALSCPWGQDIFYNVNFPPCPPDAVRGMTLAPQGRRRGGVFDCVEYVSPSKRQFFWLQHRTSNESAEPHSDAVMGAQGWITMTPMRPDLTAHDLMDGARAALAE